MILEVKKNQVGNKPTSKNRQPNPNTDSNKQFSDGSSGLGAIKPNELQRAIERLKDSEDRQLQNKPRDVIENIRGQIIQHGINMHQYDDNENPSNDNDSNNNKIKTHRNT